MAQFTLKVRRSAWRLLTSALNTSYDVASAARRGSLSELAKRRPRSFVVPPEQIATQTVFGFRPKLQGVIAKVNGQEPTDTFMKTLLSQSQERGYIKNYGRAIFINPRRIDGFLELIGISAEKKDLFLQLATEQYLLRDHVQANQARGYFASSLRKLEGRGHYVDRDYHVPTRDGQVLSLTRIINPAKVKTNDSRPSVLMVPGLACNHRFFDLDNKTSLALEHADQGRWVSLFDPRGLGKNKGDFDPHCFFDTLVSNDLPAVLEFTAKRPTPPKPVILIGHSMGGMISEFMLVRQAYKLNQLAVNIARITGNPTFITKGKPRAEVAQMLDTVEARLGDRRKLDRDIQVLIDEARDHLDLLNSVKGLITLGSPKIFDRNGHPIYPLLLMLNLLLPIIGEEKVPVDKGKWLLKLMPSLTRALYQLINPANFDDPKAFLAQLAGSGTDSFPLGVGLQLLRAVYSGKGVRRMDSDRFNYSAHLDEIPPDIPLFHILGQEDPLDPPFNLAFIDRAYSKGTSLDFSLFPEYSHRVKRVFHLEQDADVSQLPLLGQKSQVTGIAIKGIGHLDFFDGRTAERVVRPLLHRLVDLIWQS